jgi:anti-anti-sigma regulatory factor
MASIAVWTKIHEESATEVLRELGEKLDAANGDITLDFSPVQQVDAAMVRAMEELAGHAEDKGVKVVLRGINVDVYKVLKLVRLSGRFVFV